VTTGSLPVGAAIPSSSMSWARSTNSSLPVGIFSQTKTPVALCWKCQTPFLAGEQNEAYLAGEPADDARFIPVFAHALEHTGEYSPEEAMRVAGKLLPDILRYDPKRPASFPDNGRGLIDDVSDLFLAILTNGKVTGDNVGPHDDFLDEFPYLGPPYLIRNK
jgi:hypothetical protein